MHLSENQIQWIFTSVQNKGVNYIDVQHEIVDHLASEIELSMETCPEIYFQEHLDNAFSAFDSDFKKLVRTKEKAMNKYWQKKTLGYIKSYFTFPKIILTILIFLTCSLGTILVGKSILISFVIASILLVFGTFIHYYLRLGFTDIEHKYLVLKMYMANTIGMTTFAFFILNILEMFNSNEIKLIDQHWYIYTASIALTIGTIWCHACLTEFPRMLIKDIKEKYPYLTLAN